MLLLSLLLLGPIPPQRPPTPWLAVEPTRLKGTTKPPAYAQCLAVDLRPVLAASAPAVVPVRPRFSAVSTLDLQIRATLSRSVALGSRLAFHVFTPQGHLYQTLPGVATATKPVEKAAVADRQPSPEEVAATATLLVAGTAIVNHSLYGPWRVEPHIEGDPQPCAPASRFWITP